jgi:2-polyprenyl-6-methoxyphenol hydroxylase-like FAD-dependent oxidoreductase
MSENEYDAIVVGARCAGSPAAMQLARHGHRVLLVDRAQFPSDTLSTHWIHQPGVARLRRWGLLDRVVATGCPPIATETYDFGPFAITGRPHPADGAQLSYAPRRTVLDQILVEAAMHAGAEVRQGFVVDDLLTDDGVVTGIRGHAGAGGPVVYERARIVIGADGLHSTVARLTRAPVYQDRGVLLAGYYAYWSGVRAESFEGYDRGSRVFGLIPTNDGLTVVIAAWPRREFEAHRSDVEATFLAALELVPDVAERVRAGRRESRFRGSGELGNYFRRPYGPGWALIGDAGMHKDPITAQGITDAFRDADEVAAAVHVGLVEGRSIQDGLADYEERRNQDRQGIFDFTCQFASREPPPPDMLRLLEAIHGHQEAMDDFVSLIAGTERFEHFFAPDNVERLVGAPVLPA